MPHYFVAPEVRVDKLTDPLFEEAGIEVQVIRYDLVDLITGGNKWYKLMGWMADANEHGSSHLLSFGGAFSNHIAALAAAGKKYGFRTTGIIRGEEIRNVTLKRARNDGMQLQFVSRELYRRYRDDFSPLQTQYPDALIIPEGGAGSPGEQGCILMLSSIPLSSHYVLLPVATGTTLSGIAQTLPGHMKLIGISVVRNDADLERILINTEREIRPVILNDYRFGGYAKRNAELESFINEFKQTHDIPLEPVYSGRMFYALYDLIKQNFFPKGSVISLCHTGGMQAEMNETDFTDKV